jgi:hypothetical protein
MKHEMEKFPKSSWLNLSRNIEIADGMLQDLGHL